MEPPETRYAKSGDVNIAYQVFGEGPLDLLLVHGFVANIELQWDFPEVVEFYKRLGSFARVICFDKRGTGLSDRTAAIAPLEVRMDDVRAVMEAVGCYRAALFGMSEGGSMCLLFTATYPERVLALVLYGAFALSPSRATASSPEQFETRIAEFDRSWGSGFRVPLLAPSKIGDERFLRSWSRLERLSASPSAAMNLLRMNREIDARHLLPAIRVPTLVLHRRADRNVSVEFGRQIAEHVPGARYVELPGSDHLFFVGDSDRIADEIEEFLTGSRSNEVEADRVLATVLFTDIVESTKHAAELGDRQWRSLLDRHDEIVRQQLARFRGREIKNLGDGFLATFDGPARAVRCASVIAETVQPLGIGVRSGLHTGEIEMKRDDIGGIAVNIAARVAAMAGPGETLVSSTVRDLVAGSGLRFDDRGSHTLRGLPDDVRLYSAVMGTEAITA